MKKVNTKLPELKTCYRQFCYPIYVVAMSYFHNFEILIDYSRCKKSNINCYFLSFIQNTLVRLDDVEFGGSGFHFVSNIAGRYIIDSEVRLQLLVFLNEKS